MNCTHHLGDNPNGPQCLLEEHPDHPNGHSYRSKFVPDGHDDSEARAEAER